MAKVFAHASWVGFFVLILFIKLIGKAPSVAAGQKNFIVMAIITLLSVTAGILALVFRRGQSGVLAPAIIGLVLNSCIAFGILLFLLSVAGLGAVG